MLIYTSICNSIITDGIHVCINRARKDNDKMKCRIIMQYIGVCAIIVCLYIIIYLPDVLSATERGVTGATGAACLLGAVNSLYTYIYSIQYTFISSINSINAILLLYSTIILT